MRRATQTQSLLIIIIIRSLLLLLLLLRLLLLLLLPSIRLFRPSPHPPSAHPPHAAHFQTPLFLWVLARPRECQAKLWSLMPRQVMRKGRFRKDVMSPHCADGALHLKGDPNEPK